MKSIKSVEKEINAIIEFIQNNYSPHHSIIITYIGCEVVESVKHDIVIDNDARKFLNTKKGS